MTSQQQQSPAFENGVSPPPPPPPPQPFSHLDEVKRYQLYYEHAIKQNDPFVISVVANNNNKTNPTTTNNNSNNTPTIILRPSTEKSLQLKRRWSSSTPSHSPSPSQTADHNDQLGNIQQKLSPVNGNSGTNKALDQKLQLQQHQQQQQFLANNGGATTTYANDQRLIHENKWWIFKDLYEQDQSELPRHVISCINTVLSDHVILQQQQQQQQQSSATTTTTTTSNSFTWNAPNDWTIPTFDPKLTQQRLKNGRDDESIFGVDQQNENDNINHNNGDIIVIDSIEHSDIQSSNSTSSPSVSPSLTSPLSSSTSTSTSTSTTSSSSPPPLSSSAIITSSILPPPSTMISSYTPNNTTTNSTNNNNNNNNSSNQSITTNTGDQNNNSSTSSTPTTLSNSNSHGGSFYSSLTRSTSHNNLRKFTSFSDIRNKTIDSSSSVIKWITPSKKSSSSSSNSGDNNNNNSSGSGSTGILKTSPRSTAANTPTSNSGTSSNATSPTSPRSSSSSSLLLLPNHSNFNLSPNSNGNNNNHGSNNATTTTVKRSRTVSIHHQQQQQKQHQNQQHNEFGMVTDLWTVHETIEKTCKNDQSHHFILNAMSEAQPYTFAELVNNTTTTTNTNNATNNNNNSSASGGSGSEVVDEQQRDSTDLIISDFDMSDVIQGELTRVVFTPKRLIFKVVDSSSSSSSSSSSNNSGTDGIVPPIEPVYCTMALYDLIGNEFSKISESYSFEYSNDQEMNEQFRAIFKLSSASCITPTMTILFKFSRRYLGEDAELVNDVYSKARVKDLKSIRTKIQKNWESFPNLYSPFAWTVVNVKTSFDTLQSVSLFMLPSGGDVRDQALLQQFFNVDSSKKAKMIDAFISFTLSELNGRFDEYSHVTGDGSGDHRITLVEEQKTAAVMTNGAGGDESSRNTRHLKKRCVGFPVKPLLPLNNMTIEIENTCILLPYSATISSKKDIKNIQIVASLQHDDLHLDSTGLPVFYSNYPTMTATEMRTSCSSMVSCNNMSPEFSTEMKLRVPYAPKKYQHVLFKFYNCTAKESHLKKNGVKKLVGYSWIHLTSLVQGKMTLPVYKVEGKLSNYFQNAVRYSHGALELEVVKRSLNLESSDCSLAPFMKFVNGNADYTSIDKTSFEVRTNCLLDMTFSLAQYLPMILNELIMVLKQTNNGTLRSQCFTLILRLVHKFAREDLVSVLAYVKYYFKESDLHQLWLEEMRIFLISKSDFTLSFMLSDSWFLFAVLLKSIVLRFQNSGLSENFISKLSSTLIGCLAIFIDNYNEKDIEHIGGELGAFVSYLLSAGLSKPMILNLIYDVTSMLSSLGTCTAASIQLSFMYYLFQYPYYLELCLPGMVIQSSIGMGKSDATSRNQRYFLHSILIDCVISSLTSPSRDVRSKACTLLYEVVCQSTWDTRFQEPVHKRRINRMHFEFVQRFTEVVNEWNSQVDSHKKKIKKEIGKVKHKLLGLESSSRASMDEKALRPKSFDHIKFDIMQSELLKVLSKYTDDLKTEDTQAKFERQLMYGIVYHIIRNVEFSKLSSWLVNVNQGQQAHFLGLVQSMLSAFEFGKDIRASQTGDARRRSKRQTKSVRMSRRGVKQINNTLFSFSNRLDNSIQKLKSMAETAKLHVAETAKLHTRSKSSSAMSIMMDDGSTDLANFSFVAAPTSPRKTPSSPQFELDPSLRRVQSALPRRARPPSTSSPLFETYIPCEIGYYLLWLLSNIVSESKSSVSMSTGTRFNLINYIATVLTSYLHLNQPDYMLTLVMTFLRALVHKYPLLAGSQSRIAPPLSEALLCLCNSEIESVRTNAIWTEYTLLKLATLTEKNNALWPQILSNLSISRLLQKQKKCERLSSSIQDIPGCVTLDSTLSMAEQKTLSTNLKALCDQMNQLINGTIELNSSTSEADIYRSEALLLKIANLYNIPELKVMWLVRLAEFHNKNQQYAECGQCYLLIIASILEKMDKDHLKMLPLEPFYALSPLIDNRRSVSDHVSYDPQNDSISLFDQQGLLNTISKAATAFSNAEQYEHCIPLLNMSIPIYNSLGDMKNVAANYHTLADIYDKIRVSGNERQYSMFYQVGFYGSQWGTELSGQQFIYKTPKLFKLFKMTERLKKTYINAEIITSSTDKSTLDDSKRYIQVTGVKPVIDRTCRSSKFEESLNLTQFYFENAFAKNKKVSAAGPSEIFKRRVVFTVGGSFPNVVSRLPIVKEEESILTPIEAAIDNIQNQIHKLEQVLEASFTDVQELQLILQGSVRAGVNGGPQDIVTTFLDENNRSQFNARHVQILDDLCHYFLYLCEQALLLHSKHTRVYKKSMHSELEVGVNSIRSLFSRYVHSTKQFDDKNFASLRVFNTTITVDPLKDDKDTANDFDALCLSLDKLPRNRNYAD